MAEPEHHPGAGHLVPIALASATRDEIQLRCTIAGFHALDDADETQFLTGANGPCGYEQSQMFSLPYYGLASGGLGGMDGMGVTGLGGMGRAGGPWEVTSDNVPVGKEEIRLGDPVHASDGEIGRVHGLAMSPSDHHVTHVLLEAGHLWGKTQVAIPISAVSKIGYEVKINLTKREVRDLPGVELADSGAAR